MMKVARAVLAAGADMLQLRDKSSSIMEILPLAKKLKVLARRYEIPFIINDRLDLALASDSDGLHIGRGDIDLALAKRFMAEDKIIGVSAETTGQAMAAKADGASYLGIGPIFKTPIKKEKSPKGLRMLRGIKKMDIPFFAIGGIDLKNVSSLKKAGIKNIAVIRAVCTARNPYTAAARLKEAIA